MTKKANTPPKQPPKCTPFAARPSRVIIWGGGLPFIGKIAFRDFHDKLPRCFPLYSRFSLVTISWTKAAKSWPKTVHPKTDISQFSLSRSVGTALASDQSPIGGFDLAVIGLVWFGLVLYLTGTWRHTPIAFK